ncbi:hypothetical protein [Gracilibacillus sp. YIM 98692]|uniref:hypothetical protein n=1 Tax=Gracilibacillus sp. YIM 98692 TaxID=2663532 RepID=UPI0013D1993D|nr:hypothetical protein [Gracilibacillus sp. YIM 98692]
MKSEKVNITITEEMVDRYEGIFGQQNHLPPTFPMIFYQFIDIPWEYEAVPIHRKQSCVCQRKLLIGESYVCEVTLDRKVKRGKNTFYKQSLVGFDSKGRECFRCVSELAVRLR